MHPKTSGFLSFLPFKKQESGRWRPVFFFSAFDLDLDPLEITLGVLPLLQLALHVWFARHRPAIADGLRLLTAARAVSFVADGQFNMGKFYTPFVSVYSAVIADGEEFDTDKVVGALLYAIQLSLPGPTDLEADVGGDTVSWERW